MLILILAMSTLVCVNFEDGLRRRFPLFIERWAYIPWTVSLTILLPLLFNRLPLWSLKLFTIAGTVSLEVYLIHIEFVMKDVKTLNMGYWPTFLLTLGVSTILASLLHYAIEKMQNIRKK